MGYPNMTAAIDGWYSEGEKYNYNAPGFTMETGHFTAMVWKSTTKIGCGIKKCKGGGKQSTTFFFVFFFLI